MKRKSLTISTLALLIILAGILSAPLVAKAEKTDGQWVSVTQTFDRIIVGPHPGEINKIDNGVVQVRDWGYEYAAHLTDGSSTYTLYCVSTYDGVYNPNTQVVNLRYDVTWYYYTGSTPQVSPDGFAGNFELKMTGITKYPGPINYPGVGESIHCVLQGFGTFEGQTLMLSYDGAYHGGDLTGFLLK
jgi:hypothetical protein